MQAAQLLEEENQRLQFLNDMFLLEVPRAMPSRASHTACVCACIVGVRACVRACVRP